MKYSLLMPIVLLAIATPARAQFSSFSSGSGDSCSSVCVRFDLGSSNNDSSIFNNGFNSGSSSSPSNLRWQVGVTWRPNAPEVAKEEADRIKQRLDDNRSLITNLAEAVAQNKTELASGLAIILAPRLGYNDHRKLIAEIKEGVTQNIGSNPPIIKSPITNPVLPVPEPAPPTIEFK
jgi:hypothetical protein